MSNKPTSMYVILTKLGTFDINGKQNVKIEMRKNDDKLDLTEYEFTKQISEHVEEWTYTGVELA